MRVVVLAALLAGCAGTVRRAGAPHKPYSEMALEELLDVTVTAPSQLEESVREAPVPVTVITAEMIRTSGARNLQALLTTYVPGMTLVTDHNEMNVAMRGVYASSQQKILVLVDGHRLNSYAYNSANPDHGISIDLGKVKQIEVLRGPGSSLYGNVALTAVVNVVTRSGDELDGARISVGGGDYLSRGDTNPVWSRGRPLAAGRSVALTFGDHVGADNDLLLWGTAFVAPGQEITIAPDEDYSDNPQGGHAILGGVAAPSSFDLGLTYSIGRWWLLASIRRGSSIEPFTAAGTPTGEAYEYDDFRSFEGRGPGLSSRSTHLVLRRSHAIGDDLELEINAYLDGNELAGQPVTDPATRMSVLLGWRDVAVGSVATLRHDYTTEYGGGSLLGGVQVERMELIDSHLLVGTAGDWRSADTARPVLDPGVETTGSVFAQAKHRFSARWLTNIGLRFDYKDRHEVDPALLMPMETQPENLTDLSPRVALIYSPTETVDVKLSYARSFVDAPYWYRYNVFPAYQGARTLKPERLGSLQLTPMARFLDGRLRVTTNVFYNHVYDFVFRLVGGAGASMVTYANAGVLDTIGVEQEIDFLDDAWRVHGNATVQHVTSAAEVGADESSGQINNVPRLSAHLVASARPLPARNDRGWFVLALHAVGAQRAPIAPTSHLEGGVVTPFEDPDHTEPGRLLVDVGARGSDLFVPGLDVDLTVENVFDRRYRQGGSVVHPYPQAGRCFFVTVSYHLRP